MALERFRTQSRDFRGSGEWSHVVRALDLSPREAQVIECLLDFCDDDGEMATRLGISKHTVHSYFERLYRKLGVSSRCQVLACVLLACFEAKQKGTAVSSQSGEHDGGDAGGRVTRSRS